MSTPTTNQTARTGQAAHTPTPWRVETTSSSVWVGTPKGEKKLHDVIFGLPYEPNLTEEARSRNLANAAFIVRAVNSHAALVALLDAAENAVFWGLKQHAIDVEQGICTANSKPGYIVGLQDAAKKARAALKLAKGGQP